MVEKTNAILAVTLMALVSGYFRFSTEAYWHTVRLPLRGVVTLVLLAGLLSTWVTSFGVWYWVALLLSIAVGVFALRAAMREGRRDIVGEIVVHEAGTRAAPPSERAGYAEAARWVA